MSATDTSSAVRSVASLAGWIWWSARDDDRSARNLEVTRHGQPVADAALPDAPRCATPCADRAGHSWEAGGETPSAGLQWSRDLGLPDHAAASVEPSGSGDADVVWTAPEVEHVGALVDRRWAGRAPTTHVPVRRYQAGLARRGQRRDVARNGCELGRDPADRVPRLPVVQAVSAAIGGRRGPRRHRQVERDV